MRQKRELRDARRRRRKNGAKAFEAAVGDQPEDVVGQAVGHRILFAQLHGQGLTLLHGADVVAEALERGPGVEDVDVAFVAEPFRFEHRPRRQRVGVHLADHRARRGGQQRRIDRVARHQLGDKRLLADAGQVIGTRILHGEEVAAEAFPERAPAVGVEPAAQLRDHLRRKKRGKFGDEQESRLGKQRSVLGAPMARIEKQRAELAVAGVIIGEEKGRRSRVDVELARGVHLRPDVIVVPGLRQAHGRLDRADADDAAAAAVDEHEDVARIRLRGVSGERGERALDALLEALGVGRQCGQRRAAAFGQREQRRQVLPRDRPDVEHRPALGL